MSDYNDGLAARNRKALARWSKQWADNGGDHNTRARGYHDLRTDRMRGTWALLRARTYRVAEWAREVHALKIIGRVQAKRRDRKVLELIRSGSKK